MHFQKYQHIEPLGREEVEGILNGDVYVFDKLDGSNISVYLDDNGNIEVASRLRVIPKDDDLNGVRAYVLDSPNFKKFFENYPNLRLFGEWLTPHFITNYYNDAWKKLYIFDVCDGDKYLPYHMYRPLLEEFDIKYIPAITSIFNPTEERVENLLNYCTFLTSSGSGEGIVIKNYNFVNKFGHTVWAKLIRPRTKKLRKPKQFVASDVELQIVEKFLSPELIDKEYEKILVDNNGVWSPNFISKLLGCTWHSFITEETFTFIKKLHYPKIDFAILHKLVIAKVKELKNIA